MVPQLVHNQLEILFLLCELVRFQDHQLQLKNQVLVSRIHLMERNRFKRLFSHVSHRLGVEFGAVLIPVVDATYKDMPEKQVSHGISITRLLNK